MTTVSENSWKPIKLQTINWPVFRLGERRPEQRDGVVFYLSEYSDKDTNEYTHSYRIVDDKTVQKTTLGLRRLVLKDQVALFPIGSAIYFLADLIKLAKATTWFIDSHGQVFQHKKFKRAKLTTKRIKQVLPAQGLGCVLEIEGLASRFKSIRRPSESETYATLLEVSGGYILYGLTDKVLKDTWRLV